MVRKLSAVYAEARQSLCAENDPRDAGMMARSVLAAVTGMTTEKLLAGLDGEISQEQYDRIRRMVMRIRNEEPLAYVLGQWDFYGLTLEVDKRVLIPRDDTCAVTELALEQALFLGDQPRILDLCTGSGCIGLALASKIRDSKVTLADISRDALAVAKKNVNRLKLSGRVTCIAADALTEPDPFLGKFHMIVSNPPYITKGEMERLPESVKAYEPHLALYGGEDGLDFYRAICKNYRKALKPGGFLCFEFGMGQGDAVCELLENHAFTVLERAKDYRGVERAVLARYTGEED